MDCFFQAETSRSKLKDREVVIPVLRNVSALLVLNWIALRRRWSMALFRYLSYRAVLFIFQRDVEEGCIRSWECLRSNEVVQLQKGAL